MTKQLKKHYWIVIPQRNEIRRNKKNFFFYRMQRRWFGDKRINNLSVILMTIFSILSSFTLSTEDLKTSFTFKHFTTNKEE